jgi:glutamate N-acetyltransferase/amino-acid N-acetyltransferase
MAVRYVPAIASDIHPVAGIRLGTARARIKSWDRDDVLLIVADPGTVAGGVFTNNRFCAAPVLVARDHLAAQQAQGLDFRGLVVNAGNANAGTGDAGLRDARTTCAEVARLAGCDAAAVLPYSTGVIMEALPVDRLVAALPSAHAAARADRWLDAARAIMTTDTVHKASSRRIVVDGQSVAVTGIAKGSGMIHPDMATMLAFIATDAPLDPALLPALARDTADVSFNAATVDGDTSTNDSFVIAATGKASVPPIVSTGDPRYAKVAAAIEAVAVDLAQAIVRDGEGATKFITIRVANGRDAGECRRVAFAIAHSPLVKTAFFASDPNLGRIVCAVGNGAAPDLDPAHVSFWLDDVLVVDRGGRAGGYREEDGARVMKQDDITVRVDLGRGSASAEVWTCDFSYDYVKINAEYRS